MAQEVLFRLARKRDPELVRDPEAYLFGIAFNVISEINEKASRDVVACNSDLVSKLGENLRYATSATALEDDLALEKDIQSVLMELPPRYRDVLLLCKHDGLSYEESADRLGLSLHTVEKYLVRARAMFIEIFQRKEGHGRHGDE
jgi:RNA polymerase sigma-70 factor (ECF subfamily)